MRKTRYAGILAVTLILAAGMIVSRGRTHASQSASAKSKKDWSKDPDWVKTRTEMQVNLQVDNVFMSATDYSPMK